MTDPRTDSIAAPVAAPVTEPTPEPTGADLMASGDTEAWAAAEAPVDVRYGPDSRWRDLQARFVDEPESVTREAAVLVDQAISELTQSLAAGGDGSTESLRHAFRRYREVYRALTDA